MLFGYFEETIPLSVRLFLRKSGGLTEIFECFIINVRTKRIFFCSEKTVKRIIKEVSVYAVTQRKG